MFREIRRDKRQILDKKESVEILKKASSGVLSVLGDEDYPYGVPLSFAVKDNTIYFHCMSEGHKIDAIRKHDKVSFTVIDTDQIVPEEYTTYYRSVIAFGRARIVDTFDEKFTAHYELVAKYCPDYLEGSYENNKESFNAMAVVAIDIEHISGKEAIEFAVAR